MIRSVTALCLLAGALCALACGPDAPSGPHDVPEGVVEAFQRHLGAFEAGQPVHEP